MEFERHLGGHRLLWIGLIKAYQCYVQDEDQGAKTVYQDSLPVGDMLAKFAVKHGCCYQLKTFQFTEVENSGFIENYCLPVYIKLLLLAFWSATMEKG